eukprot:Nitzschia sp. Nitz4//scaffold443_size6817//1401//2508//NITZ4_009167-RA/size6817-snap-gene-0.16-mRNA-1//-1//CDS//3329552039//7387//frame0
MPYNPAHQADAARDKYRCMITGCFCCYDACDCGNILLVSKSAGDCLCLRSSCCCAINSPPKGVGCTGDKNRGEFCKLALFCCDCALVLPTKLCAYGTQCLCWYSVGSCPCSKEYVPMPVCTMFCPFLQVSPQCGCCVAPPPCPALDKVLRDGEQAPLKLVMDRSGQPPPGSTVVVYPPGTTPVMYAAGASTPHGSGGGGGAVPPPPVMSQSAPPRLAAPPSPPPTPTAPPSTANDTKKNGNNNNKKKNNGGDDSEEESSSSDAALQEEDGSGGNDFDSVEC